MKITQALLDDLTAQAKASPRLRMNFDLRNSAEDGSQRMLNALEPGTPLPIHRHTKSSETVVCLRGRLQEVFYSDAGEVSEVIELAPCSDCVALNIPIGQWHTVRVLESGTVTRLRSMDPECVTPEYVCRMLGSTLASEDIAESLERAKALLR